MVITAKATQVVAQAGGTAANVLAFGPQAGRVFRSGAGAEAMAGQFGRTLASTPAGRFGAALDSAGLAGTWLSRGMWNQLSAGFAQDATGDVLTFNFSAKLTSTFLTIEKPILGTLQKVRLLPLGRP
jgi:hypothetical protein